MSRRALEAKPPCRSTASFSWQTSAASFWRFTCATVSASDRSGLGNAIHATPAVASGIAYVPISGSRESLIAYDLLGGRTRWKQAYGDLQTSPLLLNGRLFFGNTSGTFYCVDAASGEVVWKFELPENTRLKGIRSAAAGDSASVILGGEDAAVYALDPVTGVQKWRRDVDAAIQTPVVLQGNLAFTATLRGTVYAIDRKTGAVQWSVRTDAPVYARIAPAGEMIIVGSTNGGVFAFAAGDGKLIWKYIAAGPINAGVAVSGSHVYLGTLKKEILALDTANRDGRLEDFCCRTDQDPSGRRRRNDCFFHRRTIGDGIPGNSAMRRHVCSGGRVA